jgi:alpha-galactosidase
MAKVAFIGAGSFGFTRGLVSDLVTFDLLKDAEICLMDINEERLEMARQSCQKIIDIGNYPAKITTTTNRREALEGADGVITTILSGDVDIWQHDILIPKKYGVDINVGDTRGPAGVFRMLRTLPIMLDICKDIAEVCPNSIYLNYTNPMAMLCHGMQKMYPQLAISGLCHSVQGTSKMMAKWAGVEYEDVDYFCAGINHLAFFLDFKSKGIDLYPKIHEAMKTQEVYDEEHVRNEMFLALDYYVTESSGHNSEYNWWFRKRKDLIEKYCKDATGWNPGEHAYILNQYRERKETWKNDFTEWMEKMDNDEEHRDNVMKRGHEYAVSIINAWLGGDMFEFNGNVQNDGIITNITQDTCVEVPVLCSRNKLQTIKVGDLPPQLAAIVGFTAQLESMAVEGSLTGNAKLVYQSIAYDPLTASVLSLKEIKEMVKEMFEQNRDYLPQFKSFDF